MDPEEHLCADAWKKQKWEEDSSFLDYGMIIEQQLSNFDRQSKGQNSFAGNMNNNPSDPHVKPMCGAHEPNKKQDWDPSAMLNNLSVLEKKIHQLQDLVHSIVKRKSQPDELLAQQKHLINADLTSIIVQLISTAGSLLPSMDHTTLFPEKNPVSQVSQFRGVPENIVPNSDITNFFGSEPNCKTDDHDLTKSDDEEGENLPPGTYEILQLEKEEILAPHTHFCTICGKGFKRDANLRMHMRGHGDEYKTAAALAKPNKETIKSDPILVKRYSCPFLGCKRNKDHKKFQPLKTILCVKNHYKRTHCDKTYICSRCNTKKFSVLADLKTHEKHCGRDKWLCSCGTTFSRKDKLFGHIALFQGHTPAIPVEDSRRSAGPSDVGATNKVRKLEFDYKSGGAGPSQNVMDLDGLGEDPTNYLSPLGFDTSGIDGFDEFPRPPFEDSESSFSFMISDSHDFPPKNGRYNTGSNNME